MSWNYPMWALFSASNCAARSATDRTIEALNFARRGDTFFLWVLVLLLVTAGSFSLPDFASQVRNVARESLRLFVLAQSLAA
jgi:hypothetical protein